MEYLKGSCGEASDSDSVCSMCKDWTGPEMNRIPRPYPDRENKGHYMDVFATPNDDRPVDDFQPRAALKRIFNQDDKDIEKFSEDYIVPKDICNKYIQHLQEKNTLKNMRSNKRKTDQVEKSNKPYEDYDWKTMAEDGRLKKLLVKELDKYLDFHGIPKDKKSKANKALIIQKHVLFESDQNTAKEASSEYDSDKSIEIDSDNDIVLSSTTEYCEQTEDLLRTTTTTRSGRQTSRYVLT
jgi:hypothetical protein